MAGIQTGFVTGARAKITIGGKVMAYAADVSYNVTVATIPVETMGKYEVHSNEPVSYTVGGSFAVVRYTKQDAVNANIKDQSPLAAANGTTTAGNNSSGLTKGTAPGDHLDPKLLLQSSTFDLIINEKAIGTEKEQTVFQISDCRITSRSATLNKRGILVDAYNFVGVLATDSTDTADVVGPSSMDL